jgi:hypothetical protein
LTYHAWALKSLSHAWTAFRHAVIHLLTHHARALSHHAWISLRHAVTWEALTLEALTLEALTWEALTWEALTWEALASTLRHALAQSTHHARVLAGHA